MIEVFQKLTGDRTWKALPDNRNNVIASSNVRHDTRRLIDHCVVIPVQAGPDTV
jgi:hypothetical protein